MLTVRIVFCSECGSDRPMLVGGADGLPPGEYSAELKIEHGVCSICTVAVENKNRNVSPNDTSGNQNAFQERRDS